MFILWLFNIDGVICDISPRNSIFNPSESEHEIPGSMFKITIELKDEYNDDIIITDEDILFEELKLRFEWYSIII